MKKEALVGALVGVAIALIYAFYEVSQPQIAHKRWVEEHYLQLLIDAWFKPAIILAIVGFCGWIRF